MQTSNRVFDLPGGRLNVVMRHTPGDPPFRSVALEFTPHAERCVISFELIDPNLIAAGAELIVATPTELRTRAVALWDQLEAWYGKHMPPTLEEALRGIK